MDPRSSNRQRNSTGNSKGVKKRGSGLGTGPVGRSDGYKGRKSASQGSVRPTSSGGSGRGVTRATGGGAILIVIIMFLLKMFMGGSGSSSDYSGTTSSGTGSSSSTSSSSGSSYSGSSALSSIVSSFAGSGISTGGWQDGLNNTSKLNTSVASEARDKRTTILGDGQDTVTIMVYMCGTDLESRSGMASNDLAEMASATFSDNVQIIVYTGGCKGWKTTGISSDVNQIYRVRSGKMELLVADDGDKAMTDPDTLTSFIQYCAENYPANRQDLIFWDHGGGSISGYGYDEKHSTAGSMNLSGINRALKNSGQTFDFIGFDACLMATLETAIMVSNYADYLIASEETEPGIGWYYTKWLTALGENTSMSTLEIGQNIVDGFIEECNRRCAGQKTTLSVIDLAELSETVPDKLSAFSTDTSELIKSESYQTVSDARVSTREFATSSGIDQIDLVNFANTLGTDEAKALSEVLLSAVKYNRTSSSMTNAYGISIYFPYKRASKVDTVVSINDDIGMDDEYNKCIKAFAGLETTGQAAAGGTGSAVSSLLGLALGSGSTSGTDAISSLMSAFMTGGRSIEGLDADEASYLSDSSVYDADTAAAYVSGNQFDASAMAWTEADDGTHVMYLDTEQWELIQNLCVNMFVDDGEGYVDLGLDNTYSFTDDGGLIGETDNLWFSIDNQPVAFYFESSIDDEDGNTTVQGRVPVMLDGELANLIIVFDSDNPGGYIAGARYDYADGETETVAKGVTEIEEGTTIDFLCDYYTYEGDYSDTYYLGDQIIYSDDLLLSYEDVGDGAQVTYVLTDMYNQEYWTPVVP